MSCEIWWKSILEYPREFLDWNSETTFQDGKQIPKNNVAAGKTAPKLKNKNKKIKKKKMFYKIGMVKLVFDKKMFVKVSRGVISPRFRVSPIVGNINLKQISSFETWQAKAANIIDKISLRFIQYVINIISAKN